MGKRLTTGSSETAHVVITQSRGSMSLSLTGCEVWPRARRIEFGGATVTLKKDKSHVTKAKKVDPRRIFQRAARFAHTDKNGGE